MNRAYSILETKAFDEDETHVTITGIASTPAVDRVGDIVEPEGATFAASIPLLWQHDHKQPIGEVKLGEPTKSGIPFEASVPIIREAGALKTRVDESIQSLKYGLVRAVSIGFRALKDGVEQLDDGGLRFRKYEIMELSAVSIPANSGALISAIKSIDTSTVAAPERRAKAVETRTGTVKLNGGNE